MGNGLQAQRGVPTETSLPPLNQFVCARMCLLPKGGRQCMLGTAGRPGVHIHLSSLLLAAAPLLPEPSALISTVDLRPNTSYFPLTGYRCVHTFFSPYPLFSSPFSLSFSVCVYCSCSILGKHTLRCRHITQTMAHTRISLGTLSSLKGEPNAFREIDGHFLGIVSQPRQT